MEQKVYEAWEVNQIFDTEVLMHPRNFDLGGHRLKNSEIVLRYFSGGDCYDQRFVTSLCTRSIHFSCTNCD